MGLKFKAKGPVADSWRDAPVLRLYSDGSASGATNTERLGGWGWILCEPGGEAAPIEGASGRCPGPRTTSQRSELLAAFYGLAHLNELVANGTWTGGVVEVRTDSQYVITVAGNNKPPKANEDLVQRLRGAKALLEAGGVRVRFCHIKAHAGHPGNEMADSLATLWRQS